MMKFSPKMFPLSLLIFDNIFCSTIRLTSGTCTLTANIFDWAESTQIISLSNSVIHDLAPLAKLRAWVVNHELYKTRNQRSLLDVKVRYVRRNLTLNGPRTSFFSLIHYAHGHHGHHDQSHYGHDYDNYYDYDKIQPALASSVMLPLLTVLIVLT